jgi:type I site-specific restriction endonuclease
MFTIMGQIKLTICFSGRLSMNEAETRAELIDPALKASGWGV